MDSPTRESSWQPISPVWAYPKIEEETRQQPPHSKKPRSSVVERDASWQPTSPIWTCPRAGEKTRHQPPRGKKPRSSMVAASTPGWTVSELGEIVPDPEYVTDTELMAKSISDDESSECSECSGCGETTYGDEDGSSDEMSGDMESPSGQSYVYQGPELEVKFEERPWERPTPTLSGQMLHFLQRHGRLYIDMDTNLQLCHQNGSPPDLINKSFLQWLFMIMDDANWSLIDITRVSRACSAELEDRIQDMLRDIQVQQFSKEFDIRNAGLDVQTTLAAYIKRLCLRQKIADDARNYFYAMQGVLNGSAHGVYQHPANSVEGKETMSVSVERDELSSVPEQRGPVRRIRRARRQPLTEILGRIR